jgi:hypothetical protein
MTIPRNLGNLAPGTNTSGVLQPSKGGTGLTSPGTLGNVLTSDGTGWVSQSASGGAQAFVLQLNGGNTAPGQNPDGFGII